MPDGPKSEPKTNGHGRGEVTDAAVVEHISTGVVLAGRPPIPHITERFIPVSHIVAAIARSAYLDLRRLRDDMVEFPDQKKKRRIVDYTQKYRAEFAKLLVLISWAARASDVSTAIDVRAWLQGQKVCFENVYGMLRFDVLTNLSHARLPSPDILTAVEVLSSSVQINYFHNAFSKQFREPEVLDAARILSIMNRLDSLISLRLALYEYLPTPMKVYTISSGRVTFLVQDQFTVDLFFAQEDIQSPALQWFLVDFKFWGSLTMPDEICLEVERLANNIMLKACVESSSKHQLVEVYNFLHSFTMQYKLESLFNQFSSIGAQEKGRIDVKYASAQRVLVVGFWLRKRQKDNNISNSFTVTIGNDELSLLETHSVPERTVVEYNREQLLVHIRSDAYVSKMDILEINALSGEALLSSIIQLQSRNAVKAIYEQLTQSATPSDPLNSTLTAEGILIVMLNKLEYLEVSVNPFNGNIMVKIVNRQDKQGKALSNQMISKLETLLNSSSKPLEHAKCLHDFKFGYSKLFIEEQAISSGWSSIKFLPGSLNVDELARAFGTKNNSVNLSGCLFLTRLAEGWKNPTGSSWFVVITICPPYLEFWTMELVVEEKTNRWRIQWLEKLSLGAMKTPITYDDLNLTIFDRLWRYNTARIIFLQITRGLADNFIDFERERYQTRPVWTSLNCPTIRFAVSEISLTKRRWTTPTVSMEFLNLCVDPSGGAIVSFVGQKSESYQFFDLSSCGDLEVAADPTSRMFSINFKATVAQGSNVVIDCLRSKWKMIENTLGIVTATTAATQSFIPQAVGLHVSRFVYKNEYVMELLQQQSTSSMKDVDLTINLGSLGGKTNPHLRILHFLLPAVQALQGHAEAIFKLLDLTYPVLEMLNRIEQQNYDLPECYIMVRSFEEYRIYYPRKNVTLLLRARPTPKSENLPPRYRAMSSKVLWHFTDAAQSSSSRGTGQNKIDSCEKMFQVGLNELLQTDGTYAEGSGICCGQELAAQVLMVIHQTIMLHQRDASITTSVQNANFTDKAMNSKQIDGAMSQAAQVMKEEATSTNRGRPAPVNKTKSVHEAPHVYEID